MKTEFDNKEQSSLRNSTPEKYRILSDLFHKLPEPSKADLERFYNKRGYPMPNNFKPFSYETYYELKRIYGIDTLKQLFGYPKVFFENRYLIPVCNPDGSIETLRAYSYEAPKEYKKLAPKKISSLKPVMPYGMEKPGENIVLNEGEEKAELINYLLPGEYTGISIPGISMYNFIFDYPEYFKDKNVTVLFDRKRIDISKKKRHPEIKNALNTAQRLLLAGVKSVRIALLPEPTDKEENDLDDYFKDLNLNTDEKREHLKTLLDNALNIQEYKRTFKSILAKKGNKRKGKKFKKSEEINQVETKELEEIRTERPKVLNDFIKAWYTDKKIQVLHDISSTGTFKTESCIDLAKSLSTNKQRVLYIVPTKDLANEVQKRMEEKGLRVVRINSVYDICKEYNESIFSSLPSDYIYFQDNEPLCTQPAKIDRAFNANRNTAGICKNCKVRDFKTPNGKRNLCPKEGNFNSWIETADIYLFTHDKAIFSLDRIISDYKPYVVVIDENIIPKMVKIHNITAKMLNDALAINTGNESIEVVFNALIKLLKHNKKSFLEYHDLRKRLTKIEPDFFKHLKEIHLQEIQEQDLNFDDMDAEIPVKFETDLIRTLKKYWDKITIEKDKLIISQYQELKIKDVPVIVLDATGKTEFLKLALENTNIQEYKAIVKRDNLKVFKCVDSTFSEHALTINDGSLYKKLLNWIKGTINNNPDENIFIAGSKNIEKSLAIDLKEYQNLYFAHHYATRGLNNVDYAKCNISIILPAKISDNDLINTVKAFTDKELSRLKKNFWINTDEKELIQEELFKEPLLKDWYQWTMESEVLQTAGRTLRGKQTIQKQWYFFGSKIDLLDYGIQPEIFTLKKSEIISNSLDEILQEFKFLPNPILSNSKRILPYEAILTGLKKYQPQSTVNSLLRKFRYIYITILEIFLEKPDLAIVSALEHLPDNTSQSTVNSLLRKFEKKLSKAYKIYSEQKGLKKMFIPLKNDPRHFIYCLPGTDINQIISYYPKDILIHEQEKMFEAPKVNYPKEDPPVKTLSLKKLIQNYDPVSSIFFSYLSETLQESKVQKPINSYIVDINATDNKCNIIQSAYNVVNSYSENEAGINSPSDNLQPEISQENSQEIEVLRQQLIKNYEPAKEKFFSFISESLKLNNKDKFTMDYEKYVRENVLPLCDTFEKYQANLLSKNKIIDIAYFEKLDTWVKQASNTEEKFKRLFLYQCLVQDSDNITGEIILPDETLKPENNEENNIYIDTLLKVIDSKILMEYSTYFSSIAKNLQQKGMSLREATNEMIIHAKNIDMVNKHSVKAHNVPKDNNKKVKRVMKFKSCENEVSFCTDCNHLRIIKVDMYLKFLPTIRKRLCGECLVEYDKFDKLFEWEYWQEIPARTPAKVATKTTLSTV